MTTPGEPGAARGEAISVREAVRQMMGLALGDPEVTAAWAQWARDTWDRAGRITAAWSDAGEFATAVLNGEDGGIPADVAELERNARQIVGAGSFSLADGLRGAYETARTARVAFAGPGAFTRACLGEAASEARHELRRAGITVIAMSQLDEAAPAYERMLAAGARPGMPRGGQAARAAQGRAGQRAARQPGHRRAVP